MTSSADDDPPTDGVFSDSDETRTIASGEPTGPDVPDIPGVLDWLLGGLVVVGGLVFTLGGGLVYLVSDRERIASVVASEDFQLEGMTEPEFVELMLSLLPWLAAGLVLTGLAMTVLGIAYIVHRRRVRARAAAGEPTSDYPAHALLGALVSVVTSFIPFSPVVGGAVAGYLERGDSERTVSVGAASALVLSAPALVVGLFAAVGLATGFAAVDGGGFGTVTAAVVIVAGVISLGITVGLGAVGGWIGGKLAE